MGDFKRQFTGGEVGRSPDGSTASAVWTASGFTSGDAALNSPSCPVRTNSVWPDDPGGKLRASHVRAVTISPNLYRIVANYSVPTNGGTHTDTVTNPLAEPEEYRWERVVSSLAIEADSESNPILLSSQRGPEDHVYKDFELQQLTVTRNEPRYSVETARRYINTVNAGVFGGAKPGEVRCTKIMPSRSFKRSDSYVPVEYQFLFMSTDIFGDNPHQPRILDQDTMTMALVSLDGGISSPTSGTSSLVRITTATGDPVDGPVLLNGLGQPIDKTLTFVQNGKVKESPVWGTTKPPTGATIEKTTTGAVFLRYNKTYPATNLNALGLAV